MTYNFSITVLSLKSLHIQIIYIPLDAYFVDVLWHFLYKTRGKFSFLPLSHLLLALQQYSIYSRVELVPIEPCHMALFIWLLATVNKLNQFIKVCNIVTCANLIKTPTKCCFSSILRTRNTSINSFISLLNETPMLMLRYEDKNILCKFHKHSTIILLLVVMVLC